MFYENDNWKFGYLSRSNILILFFFIRKEFNDCKFLSIFQWRLNWSSEIQRSKKKFIICAVCAMYTEKLWLHDTSDIFKHRKLNSHSRSALNGLKNLFFSRRILNSEWRNFIPNRICISITMKNIYANVYETERKLSYRS